MRSLIPWRQRNGGMLEPLRLEMEDLFNRFVMPFEAPGETYPVFAPRVDVLDTDPEIVVKVDLPGVDPKDVDVSVVGGALVLKGERKEEREEKKKGYRRFERFVGQFYREVPLPPEVDPEKIVATSSKGVITITIPKKPEAQPKKIVIKDKG
jgi:HSP20 family protein